MILPDGCCSTDVTCTANVCADPAAAGLDDDHRPIVQIANALAGLLALTDQLDLELLAGQNGRLQRIRQVVDVQHLHVLDLGEPVEVEVGGEDGDAAVLGDLQQLGVDVGHAGHVHLGGGHGHVGAQVVDHLQPAAATCPLQRVARIGDLLQLLEHELGHDQLPLDEPGAGDVGDPPVDDRAGVDQHLGGRHPGIGVADGMHADQAQDSPVLLRRGEREQVPQQQEHRQHHPDADVGEDMERDIQQSRDEQPDQEPDGPHGQLARAAGLRGSLDPSESAL